MMLGYGNISVKWILISHACVHAKLLPLGLALCDAVDYGPPGSSV